MIAINEVVHTALIEAGHMKRDYIPTRMPDEWILAMCSGGATSAQIAKTVRIGPAMAYTKARNDKLINNHHPKRPEVHYQFSTRHYTSFSLVAVVPVFETFWIHHLDPSEWRLKSQDQIRICWDALRRSSDSLLLSVFGADDLKLIRAGTTNRWTWHHCLQTGMLELVPSAVHKQCGHTGGDALWTCKDHWKQK